MKKGWRGLWLAVAAMASSAGAVVSSEAALEPEARVLATAYLRVQAARQMLAAAAEICKGAPESDAAEVRALMQEWVAKQNETARRALEMRFGTDARVRFEAFVADFTTAESERDHRYLAALARESGAPALEDFAAFKRWIVETALRDDVRAGARRLAEVQTWLDLRQGGKNPPSLAVWLKRDETPSVSLEMAEARTDGGGRAAAAPGGDAGALDAFAAMRRERREWALSAAAEGMRQLAEERRAAEEAEAARRLAVAHAEAEAATRHARQLAQVERQAYEQRQEGWNDRLKSAVTMALGTAGNALFGGIGNSAAQWAVRVVFQ